MRHTYRELVTSLVLTHVVAEQNEGQDYGYSISSENGNFCRNVLWCVLIAEC